MTKREALAELLRKKHKKPGLYPLTFAQQRVWFAEHLQPDRPFLNMLLPVRLTGDLDIGVLERSLAEIVRRHATLRTCFEAAGSVRFQRIAPPTPLRVPLVDLEALPAPLCRRESDRLARAGAQRPFDLAAGRLLRATLLQHGGKEYLLWLHLHHIACDDWSMGVLIRELIALYTSFSAGLASPLPALALRYVDFALWQHKHLTGEVLAAQVRYWKRRLSGLTALELPTDRPRPRWRTFGGAHELVRVPRRVGELLKTLGRRARATLPMTLLTAFELLLYRYTGQSDIALASPIAGRDRGEVEALIGLFSNILVVRADLAVPASFRELLARTRETVLEAYANQDVSFDRLVRELRPPRDPSRHALVQVSFDFRRAPAVETDLPGLKLSPVKLASASAGRIGGKSSAPAEEIAGESTGSGTARYDLELGMWEEPQGLVGLLIYNVDLFHATTARRIARNFEHLLGQIAQSPERPPPHLPWLSDAEHQAVVVEWNDTRVAHPRNPPSVVRLIEEAAARTPARRAVACGAEALSWRQLNRRANRLARYLRSLLLGPGTRVGLYLDRSLEMVVGILAILKCGAAYLALDPSFPRARLRFMLADSRAAAVLTDTAGARQLGTRDLAGNGARVLTLDHAFLRRFSDGDLDEKAAGEDTAYIVYTSGSTGTPKGVVIPHGSLVDYVQSLGRRLEVGGRDVYLHTASFAFSSSVRQLMVPLVWGARVVVAETSEVADPRKLFALARRAGVTILDLVPSHWGHLIEVLGRLPAEERHALLDPGLRRITAASEALPMDVPRRWALELQQESELFNMLGHSETTGIDTVHRITIDPRSEADATGKTVALGRALPNRRLYVVRSELCPVPLGAAGEICIGGAGVGSGYWGRPELTAAAFVPDPWSESGGRRLYRTGDLGRLRGDGVLVFVGRQDHQVKIRGHRVEIGEIEALLSRHPGVRQAAVVAGADRASAEAGCELSLVAYLVARDEPPPTSSELRRFLGEQLPPYSIPSVFVILDRLPLTPTGKLDRRALPAAVEGEPAVDLEAPRTWMEDRVTQIWAEVLGVSRVGLHEDFFALGGHSLLVVLLTTEVRQIFGIEIGLRAFFAQPTVDHMVRELENRLIETADRGDLARMMTALDQLSDAGVEDQLMISGRGPSGP